MKEHRAVKIDAQQHFMSQFSKKILLRAVSLNIVRKVRRKHSKSGGGGHELSGTSHEQTRATILAAKGHLTYKSVQRGGMCLQLLHLCCENSGNQLFHNEQGLKKGLFT